MSEPGKAMMGTATAGGPDRANKAAGMAMACPLLEGIDLSGARRRPRRRVLVLIAAGKSNLKLAESKNAMNTIRRYAADDAHVIFGTACDESLGDPLRVTVIATGLSSAARSARQAQGGQSGQTGPSAQMGQGSHGGHSGHSGHSGYGGYGSYGPATGIGQVRSFDCGESLVRDDRSQSTADMGKRRPVETTSPTQLFDEIPHQSSSTADPMVADRPAASRSRSFKPLSVRPAGLHYLQNVSAGQSRGRCAAR